MNNQVIEVEVAMTEEQKDMAIFKLTKALSFVTKSKRFPDYNLTKASSDFAWALSVFQNVYPENQIDFISKEFYKAKTIWEKGKQIGKVFNFLRKFL